MSGNATAPKMKFEDFQRAFDCWPEDEFSDMVESATLTARNPQRLTQELASLDYSEEVDRWYASLVLLEHKVKIPTRKR